MANSKIGHMRIQQRAMVVALGVSVAVLGGTTVAAGADSSGDAKPLVNPETGGRYAEYNGRTIDLSQGWQGAEICVEQDDTSFACYDDEADYRAAEGLSMPLAGASTKGKYDCPEKYACAWDNQNYAGKRVQFKSVDAHSLWDVNFENRANSFYNNRNRITAYIDAQPGPQYIFADPYRNEGKLSTYYEGRPDYLGSWNNKIDYITLTNET